jgi:hypothetical protein
VADLQAVGGSVVPLYLTTITPLGIILGMNFKNKVWKYITGLVLLLIILNPEMAQFALFIDAMGLETFLMLLEVQILAIFGGFYISKIKPVFIYLRNIYLKYLPFHLWTHFREKSKNPMLIAQYPGILMNVLVISTIIGIYFETH